MIYCALDQALVTSGYSIWDNDKLITYGTFKTKSTSPIEQRLGSVWQELNRLAAEHEFEYLFFEDIQHQSNVETYKKLCYTQAAILLWCYFNDISYIILSPSHWRSLLHTKYNVSFGRKRPEQKAAAQELAKQFTSNKSVTEDESDAICIGLAGLIEYNQNRSAF